MVGLGGVGLAALLGAQAAGASRVVAIDLSDEKLAIAKDLGATDCFNATSPDVVAEVREATRGGVQFAFEMAGSVKAMQTRLQHHAPRRHDRRRRPAPAARTRFRIPQVQLVAEERTIRGSYVGTCVPARDIPNYHRPLPLRPAAGKPPAHRPPAAR